MTRRSARRPTTATMAPAAARTMARWWAAVGSHPPSRRVAVRWGCHGCMVGQAPAVGPAARCSRADGVATVRSRLSTMLCPDALLIHSSGLTVMRCARTGTATALTSSGVDVVAAVDDGIRPGAEQQAERAARGGAHEDVAVDTARRGQRDAVAADRLVDDRRLDGGLHREQLLGVDDGGQLLLLALTGHAVRQDLPLLVGRRVAERDAHEEAVELRLGQGVGPFVLNRDSRSRGRGRGAAAGTSGPRRSPASPASPRAAPPGSSEACG